jgi:hypothetical protein
MAAAASFVAADGSDARTSIRLEIVRLSTITAGDLLYIGQFFRARILERTSKGVDVNGAPFTPYSTRGPYYFYPNANSAGSVRGYLAPSDKGILADVQHARSTAAKNRFAKTGGIGKRTPYGIRYDSYAAAKAAHGDSTVNLFGMTQHTHMLNTMMVRAGGVEAPALDSALAQLGSSPDPSIAAFENSTPAHQLTIGFYGPEAERAKGNNEGAGKLPKREFFALSQEDLALSSAAVSERIFQRAKAGR